MQQRMALGRREFTLQAALAMLGGVSVTVSGCGASGYGSGSAGGSTGMGPSTMPADLPGTVANNHGHAAVITGAQVTAGGALRLDIRGLADHPHTVELTAAEVSAVVSGEAVSKMSNTGESSAYTAHNHMVTFRGRGDDTTPY